MSVEDRNLKLTKALSARSNLGADDMPCQIEEGLFLGSYMAASNKDALKALNITHVLTVAKSLQSAFPDDFVHKRIDVLDGAKQDLQQYFQECHDFINTGRSIGSGVLVHCFGGMSRSVTIVVSYLMKKHNMRFCDAMSIVRSKRPMVCPNPGFVLQLKNFERSILGSPQ